ncbi:MAG TPA: alpha-(1-_3)-arabinofuranosyltransferase family protein, partial [Candidatus Nanopelagicales bacterium]|nr:alpha-(1->3)-arabinofuranosyltransferase family protein [Candidatus Nanopelagicales bacterium]
MSAAGVVGSTWRRSTRWWDSGRLWSGARADLAVLVAMAALCLLQNPGAVAFDTKLDLLVDPGAFLTRALDAWDPTANFGQVQNQAYGYLFPMGPVFWLLHAVGLPPWLVQASWAFLALAAAYLGCRVLCRRLGMTALAGIAAALAYALAPRLVTVLGPLSAEAWPVALLPWAMAPLLGTPVLSRRRAAGLSALAVLLMGAANAALTLAVLPAVGLALLARRDLRLAALWSGFVAMVSVWWVVPLLVQARVATPFLDLIESATVTTSSNDPAAVLRGTDHWVAGIVGVDGPWWPAGHDLLTVPLLVVVTVLVASVGLLGLVAGRVPHRRLWAAILLLGFVILVLGSATAPGSPFRDAWISALDGPLVPF